MTTAERFWTRRLRWRMRGAWLWPAFFGLTMLDALLLHLLPPARDGFDFGFGLIVSSFANLFLIGVVAPWLAKRLARRDDLPLEVLVSRTGSALLAVGALGVLAAGLAARPLVVVETEDRERATEAFSASIAENGSNEEIANEQTANTVRVDEDLFRICIALNDRRRASCYFVNTKRDPPTVTRDGDARPNALYRP